MKPAPLPLALALLLSLALPAFSVRALDPSLFDAYAPLTPALTQLFTDLESIPAGSAVTDTQHAALVSDLLALPPGPSTPAAADLDQLATDLGAAAVAGLITDDEEYTVASDVVVDPSDPDSWFVYLRDEVTYLLTPPDTTEPGDGTLPGDGDPWEVTDLPIGTLYLTAVGAPRPSEVYTSITVPFSAQYYKVAGEAAAAYSGEVRLTNLRYPGVPVVTTVRVSTHGLPLSQRYQVIVTRAASGTKVSVGKFRAHGTGKIIDYADAQAPRQAIRKTSSRVTFGQGFRPLTAHIKVNKVSNVTVLDVAGRVRLSRDFDPAASTGNYVRRARLTLQGDASAATGTAVALHKSRDGVPVRNHLRFSARHLPANATLTLLANGVPVGQYTTTETGRLIIFEGGAPSGNSTLDFSKTKSISLTDAQGAVLLTGGL